MWYTGAADDKKSDVLKEFDGLPESQKMAIRLGVKNAKIIRNGKVEEFHLDDYQKFVDEFDPRKQKEYNLSEDAKDADNVYDLAQVQ